MFDIHPTKSYGLTNADLFKNKGNIPVVVNSSVNNGIGGYVDLKPTEKGNMITYSDTTTSDGIFYQAEDFIGYSHIQGLYAKENIKWNEKSLLYFLAVFRKQAKGKFDYATKFNRKIALEMCLNLPVNKNNKLDLDFMEAYISKLEEESIGELNDYLMVSGLENYELSNEENEVVNKVTKLKEFKLESLFKAQTGDVDLQQKDINDRGEYFINSGAENLGIKGKTDRKAKVFESNTITVDFWGFSNYRDFKYKMATHNHVFSLSGSVIKNEKVGLYLSACMKYFNKLFSYDNMGTWNKMKNLSILLPINEKEEIDYDYIEKYITAIEKISIKNVVIWKNKLINK